LAIKHEELETAMYKPSELVARTGHFGGADLAQQRGTAAELAQICQAWGAAMATLHNTATHGSAAPLAARPWVINPEHRTVSMRRSLTGLGYATVLRAYESSPDLRAAAREVDERWTELHWIHGNLNASNVLVDHLPSLRVSFIDPDGVGLGDPAWDLASAVDMIAWLSPRWHAMPQQLVDYLLLGYRRAGGPGRLYPAIQAVRALGTALWVADSARLSASEELVEAEPAWWLDRARAHAARVGCLMAVA
jgi:aminoglycoside phosphotransferase (APT) family kinase protein